MFKDARQQLPIVGQVDHLGLLGVGSPLSCHRRFAKFAALLRAWPMVGCGWAFLQLRQPPNPPSGNLAAMSKVEEIEVQVSKLPPEELARFRAWYSKFDADIWDQQIEQDAASGKLDHFAEKALKEHMAGSTRLL